MGIVAIEQKKDAGLEKLPFLRLLALHQIILYFSLYGGISGTSLPSQ